MSDQATMNATNTMTDQIIRQVVTAWAGQNKVITEFYDRQADDAYMQQVAPGRNRAIYLLGHLIAANDSMLPMFGLGERLYPELETDFLTSPDKEETVMPSLSDLKQKWATLNVTLAGYFDQMQATDWLDRHTRVSPEDFAKEPHRNKLNVLIGRTNHQSYHSGQLALLNPKK